MASQIYYGMAQQLLPKVIDKIVQRGEIQPQEAEWLLQQAGGPAFNNFVEFMTQNFPNLQGEAQMEQQLYLRFVQPMYNDARLRAGGGYRAPGGYGGYGYPPPPPPGAYGGGGGYYRGPAYGAPDRGSAWYAGNRAASAPVYQRGPMGAGGYQRPAPPPQRRERKPEKEEKPKLPYKIPEVITASKLNMTFDGNTAFAMEQFTAFDGGIITNAFVVDPRPRYLSDAEAINAYKSLFETTGEGRQFLTVCYNKLHVIRSDHGAFKNLVKAVANAVGNISQDDVKERIRTILTVSKDHVTDATEAYEKLILDEFNYHVLCGELTDSCPAHISWTVTANSLQGLYELLTGSISKETRDTLHQIKDFDQRLETIVGRVIDTVVVNVDKRILDPVNDKSIMDIYGRIVPPIWKNGRDNKWEVTDNFFMKYLSSIKRVDGVAPQAAVVAQQVLHTKLALADKNFTALLVPRIITWSNSSASDIVAFDECGKVRATIFGGGKESRNIDNDIAFFANTVFKRAGDSKLTSFAAVPHSVICETDGVSVRLNYGITSDGCMYVGPGKTK